MTEKPGFLISKSSFIFVALTLIGIGFAAGMFQGYNTSTTEQIIEAQDINELCHENNECVQWVNENFASIDLLNFEVNKLKGAIAHPHVEFDSFNQAIKKNGQDIVTLKLEIAKLKTQGSGSTPTPTGGIILSLDKSSYERGEVVVISGSATPNTQITSSIYQLDPDDDYTPTGQSLDDGQFYIYWVTPSDIEAGTYTAIIKDTTTKKTGKISVIIK